MVMVPIVVEVVCEDSYNARSLPNYHLLIFPFVDDSFFFHEASVIFQHFLRFRPRHDRLLSGRRAERESTTKMRKQRRNDAEMRPCV